MSFSRRTSMHDVPNTLAVAAEGARARARAGGPAFLDLTVSNPTTANLPYDEAEILEAFHSPGNMAYAPESLGLLEARRAVSAAYAETGIVAPPEHLALTASTSEAYSILFKLLADPGDEILVPRPSYPLLGFLASFEAVTLKAYPLAYAGAWHVDLDAMRAAVGARTRAIVVVAPNNPTGQYLQEHELEAMLDLGIPIISDEVFASYPFGEGAREGRVTSVLGARRSLVFALSGLSKHVALPQMKLGWIGVAGEPSRVDEAMARLDLVLDAYLSVSTPVQNAAARLLQAGARVRDAIRERTGRNLAWLRTATSRAPSVSILDVEGGWYAIVRVPETRSDEEWALDLVVDQGVFVHPGYFFDMTRGAHLVVSLLTPEAVFREGMTRALDRIEAIL